MARTDSWHMSVALALAARGLGRVWPNPAVGCVVVRPESGIVVGRGCTQPGGRPHAETEALSQAGAAAKGAAAYVTLEPCSHHGETPPCAEALIEAGVARVVAAIEDPDPRVSGKGMARLNAAGIETSTGLLSDEARALNRGFFTRVALGRPMFTLKTATTLDGRIATAGRDSKWITGAPARAKGHQLRAEHDGVMTSYGTVIADDPMLNCRVPGLESRSPIRVVVDGGLQTPLSSQVVRTAREIPTWIVTRRNPDVARREALEQAGVDVLEVNGSADGRPDMVQAAELLGNRGLTRVLVEAGGIFAASLFKAELVDAVAWFRAAKVIGGDGLPAIGDLGLPGIYAMIGFERISTLALGEDVLETYSKPA
ncbi:MAG TPA: bifunctional diaminohydroxyphosphoribosylaminopyrimidine deaminase/5-amino-6-(5-phosphoribosylamino)uracil reductase RibD [Alphaproteobacteria bacterium]|nr:bifunctional diaminohydroxyphosphoribosylaminopyrimidine deaminase/5-amino-6-(5-phosphoribosylamino)uracil reductase RibD [Alphaproteobacteria bacterium]